MTVAHAELTENWPARFVVDTLLICSFKLTETFFTKFLIWLFALSL